MPFNVSFGDMRNLFLIVCLSVIAAIGRAEIPAFTNEQLSYRVTYKWGIIHKQAGSAKIILRKNADNYSAMLVARSQPWADRIFSVRDTLSGFMRLGDMSPLLYDKATHENGVYRHDVIKYTYSGNRITAKCERFRRNKKGETSVSDTILYAKSPGTDMLSVYYFVRRLPFYSMKPGTITRANIFSGKKIETLAVRYEGVESIQLDGKRYQCYKIHFSFSSERLKESSAPMSAWLRTDGSRIPVKLIGELPIGQIQVLLDAK